MDFLKEVVLEKQKAVKESKRRYPQEELRLKLEEPHIWRPFKEAVSALGRLNIIGELKKASPSEGLIRKDFDPLQIARVYQNCGCAAVSILTEERCFQGKLAYLNQVRKVIDLPILRKDFIFEPYQLYESKFFGADAVLLIAELLKDGRLSEFLQLARRIELDCLVEVSDQEQLHYALDQGAQIIGLNNRSLHTLEVSLRPAEDLFKEIPQGKVVIAESGIKSHRDYLAYKKLKANALLIGTAFMKAEDIRKKYREITGDKGYNKENKPAVKARARRSLAGKKKGA